MLLGLNSVYLKEFLPRQGSKPLAFPNLSLCQWFLIPWNKKLGILVSRSEDPGLFPATEAHRPIWRSSPGDWSSVLSRTTVTYMLLRP